MLRRTLFALAWAALVRAAEKASLRGRLHAGKKPAIEAGGKRIALEGEPETMEVLADQRLDGADLEVIGHYAAPERFVVGPFYQSKSMFVHRAGKKYTISYWCSTCSIRTYTPGLCMCCRQETELSLQEVSE